MVRLPAARRAGQRRVAMLGRLEPLHPLAATAHGAGTVCARHAALAQARPRQASFNLARCDVGCCNRRRIYSCSSSRPPAAAIERHNQSCRRTRACSRLAAPSRHIGRGARRQCSQGRCTRVRCSLDASAVRNIVASPSRLLSSAPAATRLTNAQPGGHRTIDAQSVGADREARLACASPPYTAA